VETPKRPNAETPKHRNVETSKGGDAETAERGEPPALAGGCSTRRSSPETSKRGDAETPKTETRSELPADPRVFWKADESWDALAPPTDIPAAPALKIAGPPPFPRSRFPVMGFLATVYEQVSARAREMAAMESTGGGRLDLGPVGPDDGGQG
jgi:hypothetical protein